MPAQLAVVGSQDERAALEKLRGECERYYEDAVAAFRQRQPRFLENQAFFRGFQWAIPMDRSVFPSAGALDDRERPEVINYVQPTVRSAAANKLRGGLPNPEAVSASRDVRARVRTQSTRRLLKSFLRNGVLSYENLYRAVLSAEIDGLSFLKVVWNPMLGERRGFGVMGPDGQPANDEDGLPVLEQAFEGEIDVQFVDATDAIPDPNARSPREIRQIFHRKLMSVDRLEDTFPTDYYGQPTHGRFGAAERTGGLRARDVVTADAQYASLNTAAYAASGNKLHELVEEWLHPCNAYPEGRLVVWCGDVLLAYTTQLPYRWPWVPILGQAVVPGSLYAEGTVTAIKPIQRSMNMTAALLREWIEFSSAGAILNPEGSGIDEGLFENLPGAILRYNPGFKPEHFAPDSPPQSLFQMQDTLVQRLKDVSTYSDVTRGADPGDLSGRAMAYLEQFEHGVHQPDEILLKLALLDALTKCLYIARDFYDEGRCVSLIGENNRWTLKPFLKSDYNFEARVVLDPYSARPNSPALRFAETMDALAAGAFADTPDGKRARHILETDTDDASTIDAEIVHRDRALQEEMDFLDDPTNSVLVVLPADDDDTHLDEHNMFRVSPEFLMLDHDAQMRFEDHAFEHEQQHDMKLQGFNQQLASGGDSQPGAAAPTAIGPDGGAPPAKPGGPSPGDGGAGPVGAPSPAPNEPPPPQAPIPPPPQG